MRSGILEWATAILTTTPTRWLNLVQSVPEELLLLKPAPMEWSVLDCLQHIVDCERLSMPLRVKALLAEQGFPGFNPATDGSKQAPTVALADEFNRLRRENLSLLAPVTEADLDKRALHAEYGMVTLSEFLHHWAGHDLMHTVQAERALLQPFIRGCGPWQVEYTGHAVRASQS
ncbi:MAG TPA: DinB family protein [Aggregatilineales bacterium]|nr:DinB family protein [Aggregatilineales bacterium]